MTQMRSGALLATIWVALGSVSQAQETRVESTVEAVGRFIEEPQHEKLLRVVQESNAKPAPFTTDGCSGGMSASWAPVAGILPGLAEAYQDAPPWETCCITHDRAYHNATGATTARESFDARLMADETLMQCVLQDGQERRAEISTEFSASPELVDQAYKLVANGMFHSVRLGGGPCSGLSWRWGYGYNSCFWK